MDALGVLSGGATELTAAFKELFDVIGPFVAALNPGLVEQFGQAMQNVYATIGQAFAPALEVMTEVLQNAAAIINDSMRDLAPLVRKFAETLAPLITLLVQLGNAGLQLLIPILTKAVEVFQELVKAAVLLTGELLSLVGAKEALANFIGFFEKQLDPDRVQNAAPKSVGTKSAEQIAADLAASAAAAMGKTDKTDTQFLEEIVSGLKEIQKGLSFKDVLLEALDQWWQGVQRDLAALLP